MFGRCTDREPCYSCTLATLCDKFSRGAPECQRNELLFTLLHRTPKAPCACCGADLGRGEVPVRMLVERGMLRLFLSCAPSTAIEQIERAELDAIRWGHPRIHWATIRREIAVHPHNFQSAPICNDCCGAAANALSTVRIGSSKALDVWQMTSRLRACPLSPSAFTCFVASAIFPDIAPHSITNADAPPAIVSNRGRGLAFAALIAEYCFFDASRRFWDE